MTGRRRFLRYLAASCALIGSDVPAQPASRVFRIGVLAFADISPANDALADGLSDRGYAPGGNAEIVYRSADGDAARLPALAEALVREKVDVIVAMGSGPSRAAKQATATIPIVMAPTGDPVAAGDVAGPVRPGDNVTGVSVFTPDLAAKRLALAKELVPTAQRIAVLTTTSNADSAAAQADAPSAARDLGVDVQLISVSSLNEFEAAFEATRRERAQALVVMPSALFDSERPWISALALRRELPAIGESKEFAPAGFVLGYGPSIAGATRRAAYYVDRILKGARPGELPIERAAKLDLTINLRSARTLGIAVPQAILRRADQVIG